VRRRGKEEGRKKKKVSVEYQCAHRKKPRGRLPHGLYRREKGGRRKKRVRKKKNTCDDGGGGKEGGRMYFFYSEEKRTSSRPYGWKSENEVDGGVEPGRG